MATKKLNTAIAILSIGLSISCQKKSSDDASVMPNFIPLKAEILISDISSDKCLNLEKLMGQMQNSNFTFPAATMITNLKNITDLSAAKSQYFSYSAFYYKQTKANELYLFNEVKQQDCSTVQILSASREALNYKVIESSDLHLKIQLQNTWKESMGKTQKEAFFDRIQPYEYTIIYASKNNLKIIEKYKTLDPLCNTKNFLKFEQTKTVSWAETSADLPIRYQIDPAFYTQIKTAVQSESASAFPELDLAGTLSVSEIQSFMHLPVRTELKYCN